MEENFNYEYNKAYKPSELRDFPTDIKPKKVEILYKNGEIKYKMLERVDHAEVFLLDRLTEGMENRTTVHFDEIESIKFIK